MHQSLSFRFLSSIEQNAHNLNKNLTNLQGRCEGLQKITTEQDQMFKAAVVEREQKILEIA